MRDWHDRVRERLVGLSLSPSREQEIVEELSQHLDQRCDELIAEGTSEDDARNIALNDLGGPVTLARQREPRLPSWAPTPLPPGSPVAGLLLQHTKHAVRQFVRYPAFSIVAVLSIVIGIGATTAIFTVFNVALLQPLYVSEPHRLVLFSPERRGEGFVIFNPVYEALRDEQRTLSAMSAVSSSPFLKVRFEGETAPTYARGSLVSGSYFSVLGVAPVLGRTFGAQDDEPIGTAGVSECAAVVSHDLWTRRLGANSSVLGRHVEVGNVACVVVGVMPGTFDGHQRGYRSEIWVPLRALTDPKSLGSRTSAYFSGVIGRLRPGVERSQAEVELNTLYQRISLAKAAAAGQKSPAAGEFRLRVLPGAQGLDAIRRQYSDPLGIVMGIAAVVLLIATVNVSTLLVARGRARARELETRTALGATRVHLIVQLVVEAAVLTCTGSLLGALAAWWISPALAGLLTIRFPPIALEARPDLRVLAVAVGSTAFATTVVGLLPAISLTRRSAWSEQGGSRTVSRGRTPRQSRRPSSQHSSL